MRLLAAISHHGLGHLSQTGPVLNALHGRVPELEFLIWSGLSRDALASRIQPPFRHRPEAADVGLAMLDAVRVDRPASLAAYRAFHADWEQKVDREAAWLRAQGIDAVLANVACLPLAAAARAGLPAVALCSLDWVDIARPYLGAEPGMDRVLEQMAAAYRSARAFLRAEPALPMDWLANAEALPAIAARGVNRRGELHAALGLAPERKLALLGFGGIRHDAAAALPRLDGVVWLTPEGWPPGPHVAPFRRSGLPFLDLMASVDLLVTKVGYGAFVEGAAHGLPVLYVDRPDWPETPFLADWLGRNTRAAAIREAELFTPEIGEAMARLWRSPPPPPPATPGAESAARRLCRLLGLAEAEN